MSARSKAVAPRGSVPRARSAVLVPWSIGPVGEVEGAGRDPTGPPREARAPSRGRARPPRVERGPVSLEGRLSRRGGRKPLVLDRPSARQQKTFRVVDGSRRAALRGSLEGERLSHRGGRASLLVERTSRRFCYVLFVRSHDRSGWEETRCTGLRPIAPSYREALKGPASVSGCRPPFGRLASDARELAVPSRTATSSGPLQRRVDARVSRRRPELRGRVDVARAAPAPRRLGVPRVRALGSNR